MRSSSPSADLQRRCRPLLGTYVEIAAPAAAIAAGFAAIERVHALMSFHSATSDLARIHATPVGRTVEVSSETITVLQLALDLHRESGGVFDVTVARRLVASGFLPRPAGIDLRRCTGSSADIEIESATRLRCHRPLLVDLGGIAKGHAVDCAVDAMRATGASEGIVNAGGDLRAFGPRAQRIHLRDDAGFEAAVVDVRDEALATSDNRRGRRIHRGTIATPHRGRHGVAVALDACVAVVAPRCAIADAFTKIVIADPLLAARLLPRWNARVVDTRPMEMAA